MGKQQSDEVDKQIQMNAVWRRIEERQRKESGSAAEKEKKAKQSKRLRIVAVAGLIVLVGVLSIAGVCIFTDIDDDLIAGLKYGDTKIDSVSQAMELAENGNVDQVVYWYSEQADKADSDADKADIYLDMVSAIVPPSDGAQYDPEVLRTALEYALKAEELNPTIGSAIKLSTIYEMMGDKDSMNKYGDIAQQRMDNSDPNSGEVQNVY